MKEMLYEVRYLKSSEDMILALAGQFKQEILIVEVINFLSIFTKNGQSNLVLESK